MKISVFGLGKLGACLMAVLASEYEVIGVDTKAITVQRLNDCMTPDGVIEPGLTELLKANRSRYECTTDAERAAETEVSFVIVPTPSQVDGSFSNDFVMQAVGAIGKAIKHKKGSHLVVITSTVMPGATLGTIASVLTNNAGRRLGNRLEICYSPEFIALGSVIHNMRYPDMILIGQSTKGAGDKLEEIMSSVSFKQAPVARMTIQEAELTKLAVNTFVTMKISFANVLAEICEGMKATDAKVVAKAIGMDSRIGAAYLQPATSFGGPCFPRDNQAFMRIAANSRAPIALAQATVDVNDRQIGRLANFVEQVTPWDEHVGILGMAYKPDTNVIDNSTGVALTQELLERGYVVHVHDQLAMPELYSKFEDSVQYARCVETVVSSVHTVVVTLPVDRYKSVGELADSLCVIDLWGYLPNKGVLRPGIYQWGMP